jgi:hypothetical protein
MNHGTMNMEQARTAADDTARVAKEECQGADKAATTI